MLIEHQQRESRVRFQHPIRVVTLEGRPRVIRTLTSNVSRDGLFLRMPEPLPPGMRVALSLEAGGRALALAQAEVVWTGIDEREPSERFPGCGVRFTEFMHPRAEELVRYLVHNLDTGKPLMLAPPERRWLRWAPYAAGGALLACAALAFFVLWGSPNVDIEEDPPGSLTMVAEAPTVRSVIASVGVSGPSAILEGPRVAPTGPDATAPSAVVALAPDPPPRSVVAPAVANAQADPSTALTAKPDVVAAKLESPTAADPGSVVVAAKPEASNAVAPKPAAVVAVKPDAPTAVAPKSDAPVVATKPDAAQAAIAKSEAVVAKSDLLSASAAPGRPKSKGASAKPDADLRAGKPPAAKADVQRGTLKLPSGAAVSLTWALGGTELRLTPELAAGAAVTHAFVLASPARAVFDLSGGVPARSHVVPASPPYATSVRLGKQGAGTRIVIDLDSAPKRTSQDGATLVLSF